jgi:hypothetical protein
VPGRSVGRRIGDCRRRHHSRTPGPGIGPAPPRRRLRRWDPVRRHIRRRVARADRAEPPVHGPCRPGVPARHRGRGARASRRDLHASRGRADPGTRRLRGDQGRRRGADHVRRARPPGPEDGLGIAPLNGRWQAE